MNGQQRSTPSLESADGLLSVQQFEGAGFGVVAGKAIPAGTQVIGVAPHPATYVIFRKFRKEVCAWCFRYEQAQTWKVKLEDDVDADERTPSEQQHANAGGMVFCGEACRADWEAAYGQLGKDAYRALEALVERHAAKPQKEQCADEYACSASVEREEEVDEVRFCRGTSFCAL